MRGTVVFDFDDTLADTVSFKRALSAAPNAAEVVSRMSEFVFPEAEIVLGRLRAEEWALALLTFGDPEWQERKLTYSGLLPYFDHVVYTAEPKAARAAEFLSWARPLIFVNDHGGELDALRQALPDAMLIAVRGPKPAPADPGIPVCVGLDEVYKRIVRV